MASKSNNRFKTSKIILFLLGLLPLLGIIAGIWFLKSGFLREKVRFVLESQLQRRLDHPIEIGRVTGNVLTDLSVQNIVIKNNVKEKSDLLATQEIQLKYHLWGFLLGRFLIKELKVVDPKIHLTIAPDGRMILPQLRTIEPSDGSQAQRFVTAALASRSKVADVKVEHGSIKIIDPQRNLQFGVTGIQLSVKGPLDRWDHQGNLAVQDGQIVINGVAAKIDKIETQFDLSQSAGQLRKLQLVLGNSRMAISGQANVPKSSFDKTATTFQAKIDVDLDFQDLIHFFPKHSNQIEGVAEVRLETHGSVKGITGQLGIHLPFAKLNELIVEEFTTYARFSEKQLLLREISGKMAGGVLNGHAEIKKAYPESDISYKGEIELLKAKAEDFFPAIYDLTRIVIATGQVNTKVKFSGNSLDLDECKIDGQLTYTDAQLNKIPISTSELNWTIREDQLQARANLDAANIIMAGAAGLTEERELDLSIQKIQMGKLSQILDIPDLSGTGKLNGKIIGQKINGRLQVPKAQLFKVPIGILTTDFNYESGIVTIQPLRLVKNQSVLTIIGTAKTSGNVPVNLILKTDAFYIEDYIRLVGADYPVEGLAKGHLYLNGNLASLDGRGNFKISDTKAWGLEFDPLTLPMTINGYLVEIENFELFAREQRGVMEFEIDPQLNYKLSFKTDPISLQQVAYAKNMPEFPLDCQLMVTAVGEGNASYPHLNLQADLKSVHYHLGNNKIELPDATITGVYSDNRLDLEGIGFDKSCRLLGTVEAAVGTPYQLLLRGKQMAISPILQIINPYIGRYFQGMAEGEMMLNGQLENLSTVELDMELSTLSLIPNFFSDVLNSTDLEEAKLLKQLTNQGAVRIQYGPLQNQDDKGWNIERLFLQGSKETETTFLVKNKQIRPKVTDQVSTDISLHEFANGQMSASYFTKFFDLPSVAAGQIRYRLLANNSLDDLTVEWVAPKLSLSIQRGVGRNRALNLQLDDSLGFLKVDDERVTLSQTDLFINENLVNLWGQFSLNQSLPEIMFASEATEFPKSQNKISLQCNDFDLASLNLSSFWVSDHHLTGLVDVSAEVSGSLDYPNFIGSVGLHQVNFESSVLPIPIDNLTAHLKISSKLPSLKLPNTSLNAVSNIDIHLANAEWKANGSKVSELYEANGKIRLITNYSKKTAQLEKWKLNLNGVEVELRPYLEQYLAKASDESANGLINFTSQFEGEGLVLNSAFISCSTLSLNLGYTPFYVQQPIHLFYRNNFLEIDNFSLSTQAVNNNETVLRAYGQLALKQITDSPAKPKPLVVEFNQIPLSAAYSLISPLISNWELNFDKQRKREHLLSGKMVMTQSLEKPHIDSVWEVDFASAKLSGQLVYQDDLFKAEMKFEDGKSDDEALKLSGYFPAKVSFSPRHGEERWAVPNQPMDFVLSGEFTDVGEISQFAKEITKLKNLDLVNSIWPSDMSGQMKVDLHLGGTPVTPHLHGNFELADGNMNLLGLPFSKIKASVSASPVGLLSSSFKFSLLDSYYEARTKIELDRLQFKNLIVEDFQFKEAEVSDIITLSSAWHDYVNHSNNVVNDRFPELVSGQLTGRFSCIMPLIEQKIDVQVKGPIVDLTIEKLELQIRQIENLGAERENDKPIHNDGTNHGRWTKNLVNARPLRFDLKQRQLTIDPFTLVSENHLLTMEDEIDSDELKITGSGNWHISDQFDLNILVSNINLQTLVQLLDLDEKIPSSLSINGRLNTDFHLGGTLANPYFKVTYNQTKTPIRINQSEVDIFGGEVIFDKKRLFVGRPDQPIRIKIDKNQLLFDLEIGESELNGQRPINGRFDLQTKDLGILPSLFPQFGYANGIGYLNLTLGGYVSNPKLKGMAKFQKVQVSLPDQRVNIKETDIDLAFTDQGIAIRQFQGQINDGTYKLGGWVESQWSSVVDQIITDLHLEFQLAEGCIFEEPNLYFIRLNQADLILEGQTASSSQSPFTWKPLTGNLKGNLNFSEGQYAQRWEDLVSIWSDTSSDLALRQFISEFPFWQHLKLNLEISAPENVKLISEFGDIEIETAINGQLTGPVWQPILNGRVDLLQGEFSLFAVDQPFKILPGSYIENNSSQFVFNPKYTILSETTQPIRNVDLITVDGQIRNRDLVIRANLNGYLNEKHNPVLSAEVLEKEVGEEYRLEQKQILSILTLGMIDPSTLQTATFGSTDTLSRTQDQLSPMVSSFVLQQSQRYFGGRLAQLMGFRQTRFDLNPNEFESSRFLLTKEISNRLALTYSSTFQLHSEPRIEIEYELGKNFAIKGERDQGKFGVDLKIEKRF